MQTLGILGFGAMTIVNLIVLGLVVRSLLPHRR